MDYNNKCFYCSNSEIKSDILVADKNKIQKNDKIKTAIELSKNYSQIIKEDIIF